MFANLSLRSFTWRREPVLYLALGIAVAQLVYQVWAGDLGSEDAIGLGLDLVLGFFLRGQVSPARPAE